MRLHAILPYLKPLQTGLRAATLRRRVAFPRLLTLELTSRCNASCIMCPRPTMSRPKKDMDPDLAEKILADCRNKPLRKINFFWFGESLLYPQLPRILTYARRKLPGVKRNLSTNGALLDEELSSTIIRDNLLTTLNIDIDGFTAVTAQKIRRGVKYDRVIENIDTLLRHRKIQKTSSPRISVTLVEMEENREEIDDFIRYWREKVDHVQVNPYNVWLGDVQKQSSEDIKEQNKGFQFPCEHPWNELSVAQDGRVSLCCLDYNCRAIVGDVKNQSIKEIWNGPEMKAYHRLWLEGRYREIPICRDCNAFIYQSRSFWKHLWI